MKFLSIEERAKAIGPYISPSGLYEFTKSLPFLGTGTTPVKSLVAGQWTEFVITYTVGASGLADGAWIKGTFKFYSDWALFQTSEPSGDNYLSAEYKAGDLVPGQTAATVQELAVRFDQKGHERPFQKAIIVDIVDGYLNPGDQIVLRLGDRRFGGRGTRVQTFVEKDFALRFYIDPVGTSRFAAIKPDILLDIVSGPVHRLKIVSPRLVKPGSPFSIHVHAEDRWGNATTDLPELSVALEVRSRQEKATSYLYYEQLADISPLGWTYATFKTITLDVAGDFVITARLVSSSSEEVAIATEPLSTADHVPGSRILFADLHVHSDDTVGTNDTSYNFSYAQKIAGLDIVGYTANDFNITHAKWDATLVIIRKVNSEGEMIIFPGTEWCGNSAAGGDHNVVFLDDQIEKPPEFPLDRAGNVARSFEWNEDGPTELQPGAWPLDELYATYAHSPESHLLIPHVGGRRCNLGWHHPKLERLVEIGSAWGHFEWLLRDALSRGYKVGVSANSDEHRGRCGGGVPGTAVFGTKGGLTGVLSDRLDRASIGKALRARHTFATTGERLVGLLSTQDGFIQGDEVPISKRTSIKLNYNLYGSSGFSSIEAFNSRGLVFHRDLWAETASSSSSSPTPNEPITQILRITWGGARLYDRYREATWDGTITLTGTRIQRIEPFGGLLNIAEGEYITQKDAQTIELSTRTSGDFDGVNIYFEPESSYPSHLSIEGSLGGYVKVGDPLKGNSHKAQPNFSLCGSWDDLVKAGSPLRSEIVGGADLFVDARVVPDVELPIRVEGEFTLEVGADGGDEAVYVVGREWDGAKVVTSPVFFTR